MVMQADRIRGMEMRTRMGRTKRAEKLADSIGIDDCDVKIHNWR